MILSGGYYLFIGNQRSFTKFFSTKKRHFRRWSRNQKSLIYVAFWEVSADSNNLVLYVWAAE